eukprot:422675_1
MSLWNLLLVLYYVLLKQILSVNKCQDIDIWMNHEYEMKGYHILCVVPTNNGFININTWSEIYSETPIKTFDYSMKDLDNKFSNIRSLIESNFQTFQYTDSYRLSLPIHHQMQPWTIFTTDGNKISNYESFETFINDENNNNLLLIYEGGQFMYPGVKMSFTRHISVTIDENNNEECITYEMKTLSLKPLIFSINNLITIDEQEALLSITEKLLALSQVENDTYSHWRTSSTAWITKDMKHKENE